MCQLLMTLTIGCRPCVVQIAEQLSVVAFTRCVHVLHMHEPQQTLISLISQAHSLCEHQQLILHGHHPVACKRYSIAAANLGSARNSTVRAAL